MAERLEENTDLRTLLTFQFNVKSSISNIQTKARNGIPMQHNIQFKEIFTPLFSIERSIKQFFFSSDNYWPLIFHSSDKYKVSVYSLLLDEKKCMAWQKIRN